MNKNLKFAFYKSLPVLFGYLFLGIAFGLLLQNSGLGWGWALFISLVVYAGSMQFVMVSFFAEPVSLLTVFLTTLFINSRHVFYGISFIDKFRRMGKNCLYMIFSLSDETYSLLCSLPQDLKNKVLAKEDESQVSFFISLLDHSYWIVGSVIGAAAGSLIRFNTQGIDFAMTALFVVIFVEQWLSSKNHIPAFVGGVCGVLCLVLFGADNFLLPALLLTVTFLLLFKKQIKKKEDASQ